MRLGQNLLVLIKKKACSGVSSPPSNIKCSVPQGSILGLLLFLLYINDQCNVSKALDFILFADGTSILFSHKDPDDLMRIVNSELEKLSGSRPTNFLSISKS